MTIRRRCTERSCTNGRTLPRASAVRHDVARHAVPHAGRTSSRFRGWSRANSGRSNRWRRHAIGSALFIGEVKAGRDPADAPARRRRVERRRHPTTSQRSSTRTSERCVKPAGLRSIAIGREPHRRF